jgi:hypothetical protein
MYSLTYKPTSDVHYNICTIVVLAYKRMSNVPLYTTTYVQPSYLDVRLYLRIWPDHNRLYIRTSDSDSRLYVRMSRVHISERPYLIVYSMSVDHGRTYKRMSTERMYDRTYVPLYHRTYLRISTVCLYTTMV